MASRTFFSPGVDPIRWRDQAETHQEDLRVEHEERLDWVAGEVVQRIHDASDFHDLVVQVLRQAEQVGDMPTSPMSWVTTSDDPIPF